MPQYHIEICSRESWLPWGKEKFWSRISHTNGQIIYVSEMYRSLQACQDTANNFAEETGLEVVTVIGDIISEDF